MKKNHLISPIYLLTFLNSVYSQQDMYAGFWINFENQKNCTGGFLINKQGINGLLTSAQCCVNNNCLNGNVFDTVYENEDDGNVTKIGQVHDAQFGGTNGLDYAFITLDSPEWSSFLYTAGLNSNDTINNGTITELYPVTADFTPTETGLNVCAYGQGSGYLCGNLTELDLYITVPNPWINGRPTILNVNKVDLGTEGMVSKEDIGGPVYVQTNSSGTTTAQALGNIVATNNDDPNHNFLYYMPINKILASENTELLTYVLEKEIDNKTEIKYSKWNDSIDALDALDQEKIYVYAGQRVIIANNYNPRASSSCTTSFATKLNTYKDGFLSAGHCVQYLEGENKVYMPLPNKETKLIGWVESSAWDGSNDYAFVKTASNVVPLPCIVYPEGGKLNYLAVTGSTVPLIGDTVCAVGFVSGYKCGAVMEENAVIKYSNYKVSIVTGLTKVYLGWSNSVTRGDSGGPVFMDNTDERINLDDAWAVGHLVASGQNFFFQNHFYYYPLATTFSNKAFTVVTTNTIKTCLSLANITKNQQAQIEIPPKN